MSGSAVVLRQPSFLPMSREEMTALGWKQLDILLLSGDAYVDHPSFGVALLGRWLVAHGFRVGVVAQPPWKDRQAAIEAVACMGTPRLFVGVTAGAIDSMLAHYTAFRKKRHDDAYTPGGLAGARPNRATIMYTGFARQAFPGIPVVLGGIEASLRRISHYDFWDDSLRRPLLCDSKADIAVYGMGEASLLALARIADELARTGAVDRSRFVHAGCHVPGCVCSLGLPKEAQLQENPHQLFAANPLARNFSSDIPESAVLGTDTANTADALEPDGSQPDGSQQGNAIPQQDSAATAFVAASLGLAAEHGISLPSHEALLVDPRLLMQATLQLEKQVHEGACYAVQRVGDRAIVVTPPSLPLTEHEMDTLYALPYTRCPHPRYREPVPAWEMIRTSITTHRGCGGGCSFCSLALHQGRRIASRSRSSILEEVRSIAKGPHVPGFGNAEKAPPRWAGSISDVGGPSANMWQAGCKRQYQCRRNSCMHPSVCPHFTVNQMEGVRLLREVNAQPGVRHVRVASGVRFDLALKEKDALFGYTAEFTGGQLKVAPEHVCSDTLALMRKPSRDVFENFLQVFFSDSATAGKEQYTVPYFISAFPGSTLAHMQELKRWLEARHWQPQQVQCFIPTPGTVATAMYYGGITAEGQPLYVARTDKERLQQHHILFGEEGSVAFRKQKGAGHGTKKRTESQTGAKAKTGTFDDAKSGDTKSGKMASGKSRDDRDGVERNRAGREGYGKRSDGTPRQKERKERPFFADRPGKTNAGKKHGTSKSGKQTTKKRER